jgi:exonuclease V gamma subunit
MTPAPPSPVQAVWGTAADDVWAAGYQGLLMHWDGASWRQEVSGTANPLLAVWGVGGTDVWAVGESATILHHRP